MRFGICTIVSLGVLKKHKVRFSSSLESKQQLSLSRGKSCNPNIFDHSSSSRRVQPFSVNQTLAPLEPGGRSLVARPSSLILFTSAETCGILRLDLRESPETVASPCERIESILLRCLLLILLGVFFRSTGEVSDIKKHLQNETDC